MWGVKSEDYDWVQQYTDLYWLGWVAVTPFAVAYLQTHGVDLLTWHSFFIACGMSVWWDLLFVKNESKVWIRPIPIWLTIPNPFSKKENPLERRWIIGFDTMTKMIAFHSIRVFILIGTFIF